MGIIPMAVEASFLTFLFFLLLQLCAATVVRWIIQNKVTVGGSIFPTKTEQFYFHLKVMNQFGIMKQIILLTTSVIIILLNMGCGDAIVGPIPGRRDYVWTVDTIKMNNGYFVPTRIWGSSPRNVWITGIGSPAHKLLWHYNGERWENVSTNTGIRSTALWGVNSNKIWLAGVNEFWQYNGNEWFKYCDIIPPEGFDRVLIENINGNKEDDLWGVGFAEQTDGNNTRNILMHYDGKKWKYSRIPALNMGFYSIRHSKSDLHFIRGIEYTDSGSIDRIYSYNSKGILKEIYKSSDVITLFEIKRDVYFVSQRKIFKWKNNQLALWKDLSSTEFTGAVFGRSENDFFGYAINNNYMTESIGHYNGSDFKIIYTLPPYYQIFGMMVFKDEIFIQSCSLNSNINLVVHGKLK
jgi:hypothetical protein